MVHDPNPDTGTCNYILGPFILRLDHLKTGTIGVGLKRAGVDVASHVNPKQYVRHQVCLPRSRFVAVCTQLPQEQSIEILKWPASFEVNFILGGINGGGAFCSKGSSRKEKLIHKVIEPVNGTPTKVALREEDFSIPETFDIQEPIPAPPPSHPADRIRKRMAALVQLTAHMHVTPRGSNQASEGLSFDATLKAVSFFASGTKKVAVLRKNPGVGGTFAIKDIARELLKRNRRTDDPITLILRLGTGNIARAIEEQVLQDCSDDEFRSLKRSHQFQILADELSERSSGATCNLYQTWNMNAPSGINGALLECYDELSLIGSVVDNAEIFAPSECVRSRANLVEEIYLQAWTTEQSDLFVSQSLRDVVNARECRRFFNWMKLSPTCEDLRSVPLLLKIVMKVLPTILTQHRNGLFEYILVQAVIPQVAEKAIKRQAAKITRYFPDLTDVPEKIRDYYIRFAALGSALADENLAETLLGANSEFRYMRLSSLLHRVGGGGFALYEPFRDYFASIPPAAPTESGLFYV